MGKYDNILEKDAFKNVPKETISSLKKLMETIDGKNITESMAHIVKFYNDMPKDKPLSKSEQEAMQLAIIEGLDESDREKFMKILDFINSVNKK